PHTCLVVGGVRWVTETAPLLTLATALALAGCAAVGPDYRPETPSHPQDWSEALPDAAATAPVTLTQWWQAFNDPLLDLLQEQALARNQDLAIARLRLAQARAERDQVASRLGPSVGAQANATASRSPRALDYPPGIGESRAYTLGLNASWEMDVFGGRHRALERADAEVQAIAQDGHAVRVSLLAELAADYAALRATQARGAIARDNIATLVAAERLAQRAARHGLGTPAEVAQARAEREAAEARVPELEGDAARLAHAIGVLAGGFPAELKQRLMAAGQPLLVPPALPAALPSEVIRNRPDIRAAERRLAAATAGVGVATADRFPTFVIPLGLGSAASLLHNLFSDASVLWSLGVGASQSVYDGGQAAAGVRAAEAGAQASRLAYARSLQRAFQDVEDALAGLNAEQARQRALAAAVHDSQDALDRATRLYRNGLSGYLNVLTAQRTTYQARDALALSQLARVRHAIGLYKALGAGLPPATPDSSPSPPHQEPLMSLLSVPFRIHDVRRFPLCLFDPTHAQPGYAAQWQTEMEALLAAGQPFTIAYIELDPAETHEDRKQRGLWLKHNKARLGLLCRAQISVEPDAARRAEASRQGALAAKAFGIPHEAVATLEEAVALTRRLTRPLPPHPRDGMRGWENIS
ncbi:efflux transporter outer membrane subunit, partial [Achromobacter ruhlandii]